MPPGSTAPLPGTCRLGDYNANRSESWIAVKPGTENLIGTSKVFFEKYSTFYMFHLGSYTILNSKPTENNIVQGYECVTTGSTEEPPAGRTTPTPTSSSIRRDAPTRSPCPSTCGGATSLTPTRRSVSSTATTSVERG